MPSVHAPRRANQHPPGDEVSDRLQLDHIAVQTIDLPNSVAWYKAFFGCTQRWTLSSFSELTRRRLPGISSLTELAAGGLRFHLFERAGTPHDPAISTVGYQHVCVSVADPEDLSVLRERWLKLHAAGDFSFAINEPPTEVVIDPDGILSFYAYDVNGLEFEFTHKPSVGDAVVNQ